MRIGAGVLIAALAIGGAVQADGGLTGRTVVFSAETWDDPAAPYLVSSEYIAKVADGPEFGMAPEATESLYVVPVIIDIGPDRIDLSYENAVPGRFAVAAFNGYVLRFAVDCVLFEDAVLDLDATTPELAAAHVTVEPQAVRINVSGLFNDPASRIGVRLAVTDCLLG
jgi:hypothetical protein